MDTKEHTVISILLATLFLAGFNNDRSAESARAAMVSYRLIGRTRIYVNQLNKLMLVF